MLFLLILLIISCSLDRTNPLDPLVSGESYPEEVPNIDVSISGNNIEITWDTMLNVDGYYIYRSQSYDGLYVLIKEEDDDGEIPVTSFLDQEVDLSNNNEYWYKMSAYILIGIDEEKLEGYRSEPKTWN